MVIGKRKYDQLVTDPCNGIGHKSNYSKVLPVDFRNCKAVQQEIRNIRFVVAVLHVFSLGINF